ncbi:hypothetical protein SAMN04489726_6073 [Allokutzneria albata]|uniref:Uncharacterized protein n=1 Tax=Allokutzneria albata TaxID=211114 RepID=A0A1H0AHB5_ALLAB|nr:hypothetical protein SAMN04489726_6073 [Allokutzneria albata]
MVAGARCRNSTEETWSPSIIQAMTRPFFPARVTVVIDADRGGMDHSVVGMAEDAGG